MEPKFSQVKPKIAIARVYLSDVIFEFAEAGILENKSGRFPRAPKLERERVLMPDDGGNSRKGKLEVGHVHAPDIDVGAENKAIPGIVDAVIVFECIERGNEHSTASATGV